MGVTIADNELAIMHVRGSARASGGAAETAMTL
jgi:hypothetical protein